MCMSKFAGLLHRRTKGADIIEMTYCMNRVKMFEERGEKLWLKITSVKFKNSKKD